MTDPSKIMNDYFERMDAHNEKTEANYQRIREAENQSHSALDYRQKIIWQFVCGIK